MDSKCLWYPAFHMGLLSKESSPFRIESLEALLVERKYKSRRNYGGNKFWTGFIDTDGIGNNNCSKELIPAEAMHLSEEETQDFDEILATNPASPTIATTRSSTTDVSFLDGEKYKQVSW